MRREPYRSRAFKEGDLFELPLDELGKWRPSTCRRVCVIGGGAAGLTAALELAEAGFDVTVLDANDRWGGRIHTVDFGGGVIAELGAMRLPDAHVGVDHYLKRFHLATHPFVQKNERALFRMRGAIARAGDIKAGGQLDAADPLYGGGRPPLDLAPFLEFTVRTGGLPKRTRDPDDVLSALGQQLAMDLNEREKPAAYGIDLLDGAAYPRRCQQLALWQYVSGAVDPRPVSANAGAPGAGRFALGREEWEYLGRLTSHLWFERISLLQWVLDGSEVMNGPMRRVEGGMSRLVDGFVAALREAGANLRLNAAVRAVAIDETARPAVNVSWTESSGSQQARFDFAVIAVPAPAAARIAYDPPMASRQYEALTNLSYIDMAKSAVHCARRCWEVPPFSFAGGASYTDLPIQQVWYPMDNAVQVATPLGRYGSSNVQAAAVPESQMPADHYWAPADPALSASPGALLTYMWGPNAKRFGAMSDAERRDTVERGLEALHPGIAGDILDVRHATWNTTDCGGGSFAMFAPGEQERYSAVLGEPHPAGPERARVFFAGEHLAVMHGWIQSAIQSGLAAVLNLYVSPLL